MKRYNKLFEDGRTFRTGSTNRISLGKEVYAELKKENIKIKNREEMFNFLKDFDDVLFTKWCALNDNEKENILKRL